MRPLLASWAYRILVFGTLLFVVTPLIAVIWVSFFSNKIISLPPQGYSLAWYLNAWRLDDFREGFILSLKVAVTATVIGLLIAVPASLAVVRGRFPGKPLVSTILLSPMMIPGVVAGSAIYIYYIQFEILTSWQLAAKFQGLVAAHVVLTIPWVVRLVTASLVGVNQSIEEAALNLGARPWRVFWRITLPSIRPGLIAGGMFSFIASFTDLEKSIFLIGPGSTTLPIAIINYLEWNLDPTVAAVAAVQIFFIGIMLVVSDPYIKLGRAF
jgi:putative spermidine/putrescine transport system permease protein